MSSSRQEMRRTLLYTIFVAFPLSPTPWLTLNDLNVHFVRYSIVICDLAVSNFFLLIYCTVCLRSGTARDPYRSAGSGV